MLDGARLHGFATLGRVAAGVPGSGDGQEDATGGDLGKDVGVGYFNAGRR